MKKPVYRIYIDPNGEGEVKMNSAVNHPANERSFFAFSKDKARFEFNDVQQNIVGVALVPNEKIYRRDKDGEFYVEFYAEDIKNMAYVYGKNLSWNKLNFEHNQKNMAKSAVMYMSYIIDRTKGLNPPEAFKDEPDGTWILGYHFFDKEEYDYVKENFTGWSVEGDFLLEEKFLKQNIMSEEKKSIFEKLKALFNEEEEQPQETQFNSALLADGTEVVWEGDLEEGVTALFIRTEEGDAPAPDGDHTLEDGTIITTENGIVMTIVVPDTDAPAEEDMGGEFAVILETFEKQNEIIKKQGEQIVELSTKVEELSKSAPEKPTKKKFARVEDSLSPLQREILEKRKNK